MPDICNHHYSCRQILSRTVKGLIPKRVEDMISAGNIRGAIAYLGGQETDNIVELVKERFQEELNEAIHKIDRYSRRGNEQQISEWTMKKLKIQQKMDELDDRFTQALEEACSICSDILKDPVLVPCCQNIFCIKCLMKWLRINHQQTCPYCRSVVDNNNIVYISKDACNESTSKPHIYPVEPTKPQQIINLIINKPDGRFIIFSDEDATFSLIKSTLDTHNISCKEIKGRAESREKIIQGFKNGYHKVIFLNSRNNGAGINLQECTDIILYHKMSTETETQNHWKGNAYWTKKKL